MSDNLHIYDAVKTPPSEALKPIRGGRLKGKTDINPMWRIKALTERFGPCGIGWKTIITQQWLEEGANGEIGAFCNIDLYIRADGEWSEPIPGTGGSMFVAKEQNGLYTSDECYKMAYTDAISVACKSLGFAADVYWQEDGTKYGGERKPQDASLICKKCGAEIKGVRKDGEEHTAEEVAALTGGLCRHCWAGKSNGA